LLHLIYYVTKEIGLYGPASVLMRGSEVPWEN